MIICGLKLTHDGAVAVLDGNRLLFSVEMEKLANNPRYTAVEDSRIIPELLADHGLRPSDVDHWVVDGWDGVKTGTAVLRNHGAPLELTVAPYRENEVIPDVLQPGYFGELPLGAVSKPFTSYVHIAGHLASAYCSSEFARRREPSFVLVWDGGLFPRLYFVHPDAGVENGGELFSLIGHSYATAGHHFGPYRRDAESETVDDLSVAGKLMAYIALGRQREPILDILRRTFFDHFDAPTPEVADYRRAVVGCGSNAEPSLRYVHAFYRDARERLARLGAPDEDVLSSVHVMVEELLVERLVAKVRAWKGDGPWNVCLVGGCALNIKWNSAIRAQPLFRAVWVPPFPNDSGSAIGTAGAHLMALTGVTAIDWNARLGPALLPPPEVTPGWTTSPCPPAELARILHERGQPVVVLNGRAELGPRALGGRSIIAPATDPAMKDRLNRVKGRESFRPVAPICLVDEAPDIFDPGTPDPHMLFDHQVRAGWVDRIPAVVHLDGTARLQTVSAADDPVIEAVLREYHRRSGIPVLCNTSANFAGRGFFPDVGSALRWAGTALVWSDGVLYQRDGPGPDPAGPSTPNEER